MLNFARESRNSVADLHFSLETARTQGRAGQTGANMIIVYTNNVQTLYTNQNTKTNTNTYAKTKKITNTKGGWTGANMINIYGEILHSVW